MQILINDNGVDNTHPDLAKLDLANSCGVYAPCADSDGVMDSHGTVCASLAAGDSNSACGVGVAPGAGIASGASKALAMLHKRGLPHAQLQCERHLVEQLGHQQVRALRHFGDRLPV